MNPHPQAGLGHVQVLLVMGCQVLALEVEMP